MTIVRIHLEAEHTDIALTDTQGDATTWVLPCGTSSLQRGHFTADPPLPEDLTNAIGEMIDHLDDAKRELPLLDHAETVVLTGSAARIIAAVEFGGNIAADSFALSRAAAEDVFRTLATETTADRCHNPGLPADTAASASIVGGCCAVVAIMRVLKLHGVTVSMAPDHHGAAT